MTTPAGWFDDGSGQMRYWDGSQWTEHLAAQPEPAPEAAPAPAPAPESYAAQPTPPVPAAAGVPAPSAGSVFAEPGASAPAYPMQQSTYAAAPAAPWAPGAPVKKSRTALWVVLGLVGLLAVVAAGVVALVVLARGATAGPSEAFDELAASWRAQDCAAEYALTHSHITFGASEADYCAEADYTWFTDLEGWDYDVVGVETSGSEAFVTTRETYTYFGEDFTDTWVYEFREVDGDWLFYEATYEE